MRVEAYIRVVSTEAIVHSIHAQANVANAGIKRLKAKRDDSSDEMWWNWHTPRIPLDAENLDDGLRALLQAHKRIFPIIKNYEGPDADVYLEIVTQYEEGEEPQGLYLSAETIRLLSEMGGALDNDVVIVGRSHSE